MKKLPILFLSLVIFAVLSMMQKKNFKASDVSVNQKKSKEKLSREEKIKKKIKLISEKKGFINNRNFIVVGGMESYLKGIYSDKEHIYFLVELKNTTNIDYQIESISFVSQKTEKIDRKHVLNQDKIFVPVESTEIETIEGKTSRKMVFAFEKFTISERKGVLMIIDEEEGERTVVLKIQDKHIVNAQKI